MVSPFSIDLCILLQIAFFRKAESGKQADRRQVIWLDICFNPMQADFLHDKRNQQSKGFQHITMMAVVFAEFVSKHTFLECAMHNVVEADRADGNFGVLP